MQRAGPWLLRLGAVLLLISPFLPQATLSTIGTPPRAPTPTAVSRAAVAIGLHLPVLVGLALLAGSLLRGGGPAAVRVATLALLFVVSFATATVGSLLLTDAGGRTTTPTFALAIALFAAPLAFSGIALSRWMEDGVDRSTGAFERLALALLMGLHGLFLADHGWQLLLEAAGTQNGTVSLRVGVAVGPLGALLAAVGAVLSSLPPRVAVDSAAASG